VERGAPVLLHGPLAALELEERFGLEDRAVLEAIRWHTPGHPDYPIEAWAMFIADKVEPEKVRRTPALQAICDLAEDSLERAALAYLDFRLAEAESRAEKVHPMAARARESLIWADLGGSDSMAE
jgi:HD superfamily phosphohydrolase YqeK